MLKQMLDYYKIRFGGDEGATAVEYGLMVALIAVVIIGAVVILGNNLDATFTEVGDEIGGAGGGT
jgi:pilus assembly protein Flp/PilA